MSNPSSVFPQASVSSVKKLKLSKGRKKITIEYDGGVVGEYSNQWSSRTGDFVRAHIPISYKDFRDVPQNFKDDVWNALMGEFEPDVPPHVARPLAEKTWPQKFRTYKHSMRQYMKKNVHTQVDPKGIDPIIWRKFVENEGDPRQEEFNRKNKRNREKSEFSHCLGRRTYAQKEYLMVQENPSIVMSRADKWLAAHERVDGTILESAKYKYEQVKAAADRSESSNGERSLESYDDIDSDEIAEVFGKQKNGGVHAMGSYISEKQLSHIALTKSKIQLKDKALKEASDMNSKILSRIDGLEGIICSLHSKFEKSSYIPTSSSDLGPNSISPPFYPTPHLNNMFDTLGVSNIAPLNANNENPRVILCDKFGKKKVAKGHVVTNGTAKICHFKNVGDDEKKIYIEEVLDPDARLWDPPQGGYDTLAGFVQGEFFIWLERWLVYV